MEHIKKSIIVTLADKNYIDQAKQLFSSVYYNAGWQGEYMLLAHELPDEDVLWFKDKGIVVKHCQSLHPKGFRRYPATILSKFYLFTSEMKRWRRVVFLDGDVIVRGSLDELTDVHGIAFAEDLDVVKVRLENNFHPDAHRNEPLWGKLNRAYDLKVSTFNSGVIAFNTDIIQSRTFDDLVGLFREYADISLLAEQAVLNLYFKNWQKLPLAYNFYVKESIWKHRTEMNAAILHFNDYKMHVKPWNRQDQLFTEWKRNLDRANDINLAIVPKGKEWDKGEIKRLSARLRRRILLLRLNAILSFLILRPDEHADKKIKRVLGKIGILTKKVSPTLYYAIKQREYQLTRMLKRITEKFSSVCNLRKT